MLVDRGRRRWMIALTFISVFAALCISLVGCNDKGTNNSPLPVAAVTPNDEDPQWITRDPNKPAKIAVVFVHGIFGNTKGTWTNSNGTTFFQLLKADPDVGPKVDVYAFGFESKMFGGSGSLDVREGANKLKTYLSSAHVDDYPAVVFVGHSMGGLVILRYLASALDKDQALAARAPLVVLYGSPQEGAQIASIAKLAISNPALASMRPADDNQWLQQLADDWTGLVHKPTVTCGYEKASTHGLMVVPWTSSTRFCSEPGLAIEGADHISMVKPDRPSHPSVVLLTDSIKRYVVPKEFGAVLKTPDFIKSGDNWRFTMDSARTTARVMNVGRAALKFWIAEISDSKLLIFPSDAPSTVPGNSSQSLTIALLSGADSNQYSFRLQSDTNDDEHVVVDVPNLAQLRVHAAVLSQSIVKALNLHFDGAGSDFNSTTVGEPASPKTLAKIAFDVVGKDAPDLPEAARWIVTADALSAAALDKISLEALRNAENSSPEIAQAASVKNLNARVQFKTIRTKEGQDSKETPTQMLLFKRGEFELFPLNQWNGDSATKVMMQKAFNDKASSSRAYLDLAEHMKQVPALEATGLTLEGEVKAAYGDKLAARAAYSKAVALEPTPNLLMKVAK